MTFTLIFFVTAFSFQALGQIVSVHVGYNNYRDDTSFNAKLIREGNTPIGAGWTVGGEGNIKKLPISSVPIELNIPIGAEYLSARTETNHSGTLVRWSLPVVGLYVAPTLKIRESLYAKVGVGYYRIPESLSSLVVSDRRGKLSASGNSVGFRASLGYLFGSTDAPVRPFVEAGYRVLTFDTIQLTPKDGFVISPGLGPVQPTSLPESISYSGILVEFGLAF